MRFNHTKSAIHSPGHSHSLFTSARDCESAHWIMVLHISVHLFTKCQYKTNAGSSLTVPCVRCKQLSEATMEPTVEKPGHTCGLHVESLTRNESTCACPARSYWAMTSMRERKSKDCASVPNPGGGGGGGGVLTIFWVTGRLGPFDPPFSTYVEFDLYFWGRM